MIQEPGEELNQLSKKVIGAAIAVHKELGPGYLESVYESALCIELTKQQIPFLRQYRMTVMYAGHEVGEGRIDLLVDARLVIELKAVERTMDLHKAQVLAYLKATRCQLGLLINFNVTKLYESISRIVNTGR